VRDEADWDRTKDSASSRVDVERETMDMTRLRLALGSVAGNAGGELLLLLWGSKSLIL